MFDYSAQKTNIVHVEDTEGTGVGTNYVVDITLTGSTLTVKYRDNTTKDIVLPSGT